MKHKSQSRTKKVYENKWKEGKKQMKDEKMGFTESEATDFDEYVEEEAEGI